MKVSRAFSGHALAFFTVFVWTVTFVSTKILLVDFQPVEILFLRIVMAFCALYAACPGALPSMTMRRRFITAAAGLSGICPYYLLENIALTYTMASNVAVILTVTPIFTALVAKVVLKGEERLGLSFYVGFICAMTGICLISFNGTQLSLNPFGDFLAVAAALVWAFYACLTRIMGIWGCNPIQITASLSAGASCSCCHACFFSDFRWKQLGFFSRKILQIFFFSG